MKLLFDPNLSFKLCQALADLFPGSIHVRLLGLAEAGFYPGVVLYLTWWFPSYYRTRTPRPTPSCLWHWTPILLTWLPYMANPPKSSGFAVATSPPTSSKGFFATTPKPSLPLSRTPPPPVWKYSDPNGA